MIRTKGEAGTGDVIHAVKHMRQIVKEMRQLTVMSEEELFAAAANADDTSTAFMPPSRGSTATWPHP